MEAEEINGLLWESLAQHGKAKTCDQLVKDTGVPLASVQVGLSRLRQANLVQAKTVPLPASYEVILVLDGFRWAQAVGLGVSLMALERYAHVSSAGRAEALRLATDGTIERLEEERKEEKQRQREVAIRGRAASRAAATDLAQILEDTRLAMQGVGKAKSSRDEAVVMLLKQANAETQKALDGLVKAMQSK